MTSFIDPLIAFVSAHAWLAYLTLFLAALLEAVPVVGSVIPGSTIILALSALVPGGELQLEWVLAAAVAGALLGDGSAFWIGHRAQREILERWPMSNYPARGRAERGVLSSLGHAGRVLRALRAADPGLRADHGRRARTCRRCASMPSIFRRSCCGRRRMCCRACSRFRRCTDTAGCRVTTPGIAKHYWMLLVIGGALLIVALATWIIRRRRDGGASSSRRGSSRIAASCRGDPARCDRQADQPRAPRSSDNYTP